MSEDDAVEVAYFPDPGEVARPWTPPVREPWQVVARRHAWASVPAFLVLPLFGAPVALLWRAVTPKVGILRTPNGPVPTGGESDQFFAIDGWFVAVTLLAGLALGVLAWYAVRRRTGATPAGLALGGLLAAAVTAAVGGRFVVDRYLYGFCHQKGARCTVYDGTLHLRASGALVVWPIAMLVAYAAMSLIRDRD